MRLINQTETRSFNMDNIDISTYENCLYATYGELEYLLGEYETSERAKEVFKDIHKAYSGAVVFTGECIDYGIMINMATKNPLQTILTRPDVEYSDVFTFDNAVYKMPIK